MGTSFHGIADLLWGRIDYARKSVTHVSWPSVTHVCLLNSGYGVVHRSRGHQHGPQHSQRIDHQMPLATADLLAAVIATLFAALLGGFHRLAVDRRHTWGIGPAGLNPNLHAQGSDEFIPGAVVDPGAVVVVAGLP